MTEHEQPSPEDQGFTAPDLEADGATNAESPTEPEQSREQREGEIDRRFFEAQKQQMERELQDAITNAEMSRAALEKARSAGKDDFQLLGTAEFFERQVKMWEEIKGIAQDGIERADTGLARLDEESSSAAA